MIMNCMNKDRAIEFVKNKILDLKDDLDHEEYVEQDELKANRIKLEIEGFEKVLDCLVNSAEDHYNNSLNFIWNKISTIRDSLLDEEDRVKRYMLECDLKEYQNIESCLNYKMLEEVFDNE